METDESNKYTLELRETLNKLRSKVEQIGNLKKEPEVVLQLYKDEIVSHLLNLRRLNRASKDKLEEKHDKVRDLHARLVSAHETCNNLLFEATFLRTEVNNAKERISPKKEAKIDHQGDVEMVTNNEHNNHNDTNNYFDPEKVCSLDHETRSRLLDEEGKKRKKLGEDLASLTKEADDMEVVVKTSENNLNQVKPFIKQLIDNVSPLPQPPKAVTQ